MRKFILCICAVFLAAGVYSQTGGEPLPGGTIRVSVDRQGREAFKSRESIFNANGRIDEVIFFYWDASYSREESQVRRSASGTILEQIEFVYQDSRGPLIKKITRDAENRIRNSVIFEYNPQGRLSREAIVDERNRAISSYEYTYDSAGNQIRRIFKDAQGITMAETVYTFDNRRITRSETRDSGGNRISYTEYQYNSQGNLSVQLVHNAEGQIASTIRMTWQDGLEIKKEILAADGTIQMEEINEYRDGLLRSKIIENIQGKSTRRIAYGYSFGPGQQTR
ncbi:MAG: hypothetical protein LBH97_07905 [Treponema sp.]|jgi:YD repeat-containing protein|nr:hypothetical protein [Treponema sp.]